MFSNPQSFNPDRIKAKIIFKIRVITHGLKFELKLLYGAMNNKYVAIDGW